MLLVVLLLSCGALALENNFNIIRKGFQKELLTASTKLKQFKPQPNNAASDITTVALEFERDRLTRARDFYSEEVEHAKVIDGKFKQFKNPENNPKIKAKKEEYEKKFKDQKMTDETRRTMTSQLTKELKQIVNENEQFSMRPNELADVLVNYMREFETRHKTFQEKEISLMATHEQSLKKKGFSHNQLISDTPSAILSMSRSTLVTVGVAASALFVGYFLFFHK